MLRSLTARTVAALGLLAVFVGAMFALLLVSVHDRNLAAKDSRAASARVAAAADEQKLLLDVETGLRGYLITGDRAFLQPFTAARSLLPRQGARLGATPIRHAVDGYLRDYADPLAQVVPPRSRAARARIVADGKQRMDAIRGLLDGYIGSLQAARPESGTRTTVLAVGGLVSSVLLVLLVALYQLRSVLAPVG